MELHAASADDLPRTSSCLHESHERNYGARRQGHATGRLTSPVLCHAARSDHVRPASHSPGDRDSRHDASMVVAALSTSDKIGLVVATTGVLVLIFTAFNAWLAVANERKRTQPIVIAHEEHGRRFSKHADFFGVGAYVTNEGNGVAFNVRFGVEFHGVRYPYKLRGTDPRGGNVQRVLRASERRPAAGCWEVLVDQLSLVAGDGDPDPGRLYWARYENA